MKAKDIAKLNIRVCECGAKAKPKSNMCQRCFERVMKDVKPKDFKVG